MTFIVILSLNITLMNDSNNEVVSLTSIMKIALAEDSEGEEMRGLDTVVCPCPDAHHYKTCCNQGYEPTCTKTCN